MVRIGSRDYWRDRQSHPEDWRLRSMQAARFVSPGAVVLDIGCGPHMALRHYLPTGCDYIPADIHQWTPEVRHVDVDANTFPGGMFDCVVLLGVLEYLTKPELAFAFARNRATAMVVSYCHPTKSDLQQRDKAGWINAFSMDDLSNLAAENRWRIARSETFRVSPHTRQMVHQLFQGD
jgi:2-polyprenyl-3-methyl-5-hydroxy-6-metoxy-1,4-benzoquinol methylase